MTQRMGIRRFISSYFHHFNAASLRDAAQGYVDHLSRGGVMLLAMAGAMSTAELGRILASMIRSKTVHAISCTAANIEEELFNLVGHTQYKRISEYRNLSLDEEEQLLKGGFNRVTDTCIPESEAIAVVSNALLEEWIIAGERRERRFFHEYLFALIRNDTLRDRYQIDPKDSWLVAAAEADLPVVVPGWEDSSLGSVFVGSKLKGIISDLNVIRPGIEYSMELAKWYEAQSQTQDVGFFQIGGGIAGDFAISIVPLLWQDAERAVPRWSYYCQIGDSITSYGSYSGAAPNEKISWGKLSRDTLRFSIQSDATIVAPLIFAYVLDM